MSTATFKWAYQGDKAWASQAVERNGKWYWYVAAKDGKSGQDAIGVAVADSPEGPYIDPLGKPLIPGRFGFIDPTVFIDDDDQAYLFWGNNGLWYCMLNKDMITLGSDIMNVEGLNDEDAFGPLVMKRDYATNTRKMKTGFEEGPWVFKRNGTYYMVYAAGGVPEHMAYSTASDIKGPWKYQGKIMDVAEGSFTIHGGNIEFKGKNYMFYHNGKLPNGDGFRRSTCIEEFEFGPDGKIPFIKQTIAGVSNAVSPLNPYERVEAETMAGGFGLKTDRKMGKQHHITSINNGDWLKIRSVDLGEKAPVSFLANVASVKKEGMIEVRLDRLNGPVIATLNVIPTGSLGKWQLQKTEVKKPKDNDLTGVHDIYFLFRGGEGELFNFDWWKFTN